MVHRVRNFVVHLDSYHAVVLPCHLALLSLLVQLLRTRTLLGNALRANPQHNKDQSRRQQDQILTLYNNKRIKGELFFELVVDRFAPHMAGPLSLSIVPDRCLSF
jgi:hypothetical protein